MTCLYCNNSLTSLVETKKYPGRVFIKENIMVLAVYNKQEDRTVVSTVEIKYCPMCGRVL